MHHVQGFADQAPVTFNFFGYDLAIPSGHPLHHWFDPQSRFYEPYRESGLIKLAQALSDRPGTAIDIGANVGDTCAILHRHSKLDIVCIDASDFFFSYLKRNVARHFSDRATARHAYVLPTVADAPKALYHWGGTAKPIEGAASESAKAITVAELLETTDRLALFKTDTDGFDVDLVYAVFRAAAPEGPRFPIYFEFEFVGCETAAEVRSRANRLLTLLALAPLSGYDSAFVWDAPGRFYGLIDLHQQRNAINAINYLGHDKHQSVWGYDICLIHRNDAALAVRLAELISRDAVLALRLDWKA